MKAVTLAPGSESDVREVLLSETDHYTLLEASLGWKPLKKKLFQPLN